MIEILMVIILLGIVSAIALPQFIDFRGEAKEAVTKSRMASLREAIVGSSGKTGYLSHMSASPAALSDLVNRGTKPVYDPINKMGWNGPYIDSSVTGWDSDAWGIPYEFSNTSRSIKSCGPNTVCGDADDIVVSF